jgi:hypothetical protein
MMTLTQWNAREDLQSELAKVLETPALRTALEVLIHAGLPGPIGIPLNGSPLEHGALLNARREGYYEFYRLLHKLTTKPAPIKSAPQAWQGKHVLDPND